MNALVPMQPELRALMLFDRVPAGCTTFLCTDRSSLPHVRPGEYVIIDPNDRKPRHGELFVIKFGDDIRRHHIYMTRRGGGFGMTTGWRVGAVVNDQVAAAWRRAKDRTDLSEIEKNRVLLTAHCAAGAWMEGPYDDEGRSFDHLCNCLVGSVIGLYVPTFEEPKRLIAPT